MNTFRPAEPRILPPLWMKMRQTIDGAAYMEPVSRLSVIVTGCVELDGRRWVHASCAKPDRLPTWQELSLIKEVFIGVDKAAYQVLPPRDKHVNLHPFCLHLWHCLDGDPLPDFTQGGGSL